MLRVLLVAVLLLAPTAIAPPPHHRPFGPGMHERSLLAPVAGEALRQATHAAADLGVLDRQDPTTLDHAWFTAMRTAMWTVHLLTDLRDALPSAQPIHPPAGRDGLLEPLTPPRPPWLREVLNDVGPLVVPAPPVAAPTPPATHPALAEVDAAAATLPLVVLPPLAPPPVGAPPVAAPEPPASPQAPAAPALFAPTPAVAAPEAPSCVVAGTVAVGVGCLALGLASAAGTDAALREARAMRLPSGGEGMPGAASADTDDAAAWEPDLPGGPAAGIAGVPAEPLRGAGTAGPQAPLLDVWSAPALLSLSAAALLLPFLVLYRRVLRDNALQNDLRRRLLVRICAEPGVTIDRLARAEGVAYQTVQHHVRVLHDLGYLEPWRDGARVHLFENGGRYAPEEKRRFVLQRRASARVLEAVRRNPGAGPASLARALGVSRGTVRFHLEQLQGRGLVRLERGESVVRAFAADAPPS